jgi:uncharacterized GH25 family protein
LPESGGKSTIYLSWGHRLPVDDLVDAIPLERYEVLAPDGTATALKKEGISLQENSLELKVPGVHTAIITRKPSVFTYVIGDDGDRQLKRGPKTEHPADKVASGTKYLQAGKALIVVGKPMDAAPKPLGLPLEITPLDGPAKWLAGKDVRFQIALDGKPVPVAEVQARPIGFEPDHAWNYSTESNRKGEFTVRPDRAGIWVVKVAFKKLTKGKTRDEYDFEAYTATLTLEVQP